MNVKKMENRGQIRWREETAREIILLNEARLFEAYLSGRKIKSVYELIAEDNVLLNFIDEIAKERLRKEGEFFVPDTFYHRQERVKRILSDEKGLPSEIYNYL